MGTITADYRRAALRHGVVIRSRANDATSSHAFAAMIEMANYGYRVNPEDLRGMSSAALRAMLDDARAIKGADRDMTPIYPGFPKQVQDLDTLTLIVEQILHYWSGGTFLPDYPHVVREGLPLEDIVSDTDPVQVLPAGAAARHFITELTRRGVAISEAERALLRGSVAVTRPDADTVREVLRGARNDENVQVLISALLSEGVFGENDVIVQFAGSVRTVDSLLRLVLSAIGTPYDKHAAAAELAVDHLSDRSAYAIRIASMSRPARRAVMEALGRLSAGFYADNLVLKQRLWRKVMRSVHPYSQIELSDAARRAADVIHSNGEYRTLDSLVEKALADGDTSTVIELLSENRPHALLERLVEILRSARTLASAKKLAAAVEYATLNSSVTTLVRAYNGVAGANFDGVKLVRVAGRNNRMISTDHKDIPQRHIETVLVAITKALTARLAKADAPLGTVGIESDVAVPLVRRDLSNTDRVLDRGARIVPVGEGRVLRVFSHWRNTHTISGYLDVGVALLDGDFVNLAISTWNTWDRNRSWSTYSGDKQVHPGGSAVEFFDVELDKVRKLYPSAKWAVMTVQSWSGIPLNEVDMVAGTMRRSAPNKGDSFDARTITSAFSPTTEAFQALPLAYDLDTDEMVWLDTSSGSTATGVSAADDGAIGAVVRDELARPRLLMGELAMLWADAHGVDVNDAPVDRDAVLALLN